MIDLSNTFKTAKSVITANSPVLLVGAAVAGVVTTGYLAAKGGYKARGVLDEAERERAEANLPPHTTMEKAQLTWLCYASPAVAGASTIASVLAVHSIHTKRAASMAALYAVSQNKLDDYRLKAEELLGSKKTQQLNDALATNSVQDNPPAEDYTDVIITGRGTELMQDGFSKRYFTSSVPEVEVAFAKLGAKIEVDGDASLNDYYDMLGMEPLDDLGLRFGWSGTGPQPRFGSTNTPDGRAAVVVMFHKEPKDNLGVV